MAHFTLIHGSCHAGWCWDLVAAVLRDNEHTVVAPDLPSHGRDKTPASSVTLESYAQAIISAIDTPTILVGHSMAGYPITAAAALAPEKISQLIYLCAYVPQPGKTLADMRRMAPSQPLRDAIIVADNRTTFTIDPDEATRNFYHDVPADLAKWAVNNLGAQPILPQETPFDYPMPTLPRHYIRCTEDRTIPPAFQVTMTADWPTETVSTMPTSHSPFLADPAGLAAHLIKIAGA